jgi:hypothetical protein
MMKTHPRTSRPQFCVPGVTLIYVLYRAVGGWRCKNSPTIFAANPDIFLQITTSHFSSESIPVLGEECLLSLARWPHTRTWMPEATAYKQQVLA